MHPSQSIVRKQSETFSALSGIKEGLTYDKEATTVMYLRRVGVTLAIECYVNGRHSHTVDCSQANHAYIYKKFKSMGIATQ